MWFTKLRQKISGRKLSLKGKLSISLSAIAVTLLISSIISVMEYTRMSSYVSGLIADNINSISVVQRMSEEVDAYNLEVLSVIGDDISASIPVFDQQDFMARCDSLKTNIPAESMLPLADSVVYSYTAYMLTTLELKNVLLSDFIDSRSWYFERLQPRFNRLHSDIDSLSAAMYSELKRNSETFDRGFYRSIIPGLVAVFVGLLLILMLLFFILAFYVNPIYKMLAGLDNYRTVGKKYTYVFDGDDQLSELNDGITEITEENQQLRKRLQAFRNNMNQQAQ